MTDSAMLPDEPERWLPVLHWEDRYEVSSLGRVRSLLHMTVTGMRGGKMVAPHINQRGYFVVDLKRSSGGRQERATRQVHRLVLEAFDRPCPSPRHEACHGPNGKLDNRASELRWGTPEENNGPDKVRDGKSNRGERCGSAKLTAEIVTQIRLRYAAGEDQTILASEYGVRKSAISRAVTGATWAHLPSPVGEVRPPQRGTRGEKNKGAKLTWAKVAEIRQRYAAGGVTYGVLGREYGVDQSIIGDVVKRRTWKDAA